MLHILLSITESLNGLPFTDDRIRIKVSTVLCPQSLVTCLSCLQKVTNWSSAQASESVLASAELHASTHQARKQRVS